MLLLSVTWQSIVPLQLHYLCHIPSTFLPVTPRKLSMFIHHHGLLKILQYHQPITLQFRIFVNLQNCIIHVLVPSTFFKTFKTLYKVRSFCSVQHSYKICSLIPLFRKVQDRLEELQDIKNSCWSLSVSSVTVLRFSYTIGCTTDNGLQVCGMED
jgi:hypothetical protein